MGNERGHLTDDDRSLLGGLAWFIAGNPEGLEALGMRRAEQQEYIDVVEKAGRR